MDSTEISNKENLVSKNQFKADEINFSDIFVSILRRKKLVGTVASFVLILTGFITVFQRIKMPVYKGNFRLLIKDPITQDDAFQQNVSAVFALNDPAIDQPTLISFLTSSETLKPLSDKYPKLGDINIRTLRVGRRGDTAEGILDITLRHPNLKEGRKIIKDLSSLYLNVAREQKQKRLSSGIKFLDSQIPMIRKRAVLLENKLSNLRTKNGSFDPNIEGELIKENLALTSRNLNITKNEAIRLKQIKQDLERGNNLNINFTELYGAQIAKMNHYDESANTSGLPYRPFIALEEAENELSEAKLIYLPNSSTVKSLESRVKKLRPIVIDAAIELNKQRVELLVQRKAIVEKDFAILSKSIVDFNTVGLDLKVAKDELGDVLTAKAVLRQDMAQKANPWSLINTPSMKKNPVSPSYLKNLVLGIFFGSVSGIFAGLLRDRLDHVFHDIEEVKLATKIPHLAHIPYVEIFKNLKENKKSIIDALQDKEPLLGDEKNVKEAKYQRFFYQEAFRTLYTSIRFLSAENKLKSITLTSSVPSEGKSLVNLIFSKTLADVGEKVLLIDCDLRKPTLHTRLGMNNLKGLSNLLIDKKTKINDVVQSVPGYKNWKIITSGIKPPDPTRLLSSKRFSSISEEISNSDEFDIVIFDTPPVAGISDATLVAEKTDGIILIVSLNNVDRNIPKEN